MKKETWRIIPSYPDYEASCFGRIRRSTPRATSKNKPIILKQHKSHYGYYMVTLMKKNSNKWRPVTVGRCVCEAFYGTSPKGKNHAAHNDGNKDNNGLSNLSWKSAVENNMDKIAHGTYTCGEKSNGAKLTEKQVIKIRADRNSGMVWKKLSEKYGVSVWAVRDVCNYRSWKHI